MNVKQYKRDIPFIAGIFITYICFCIGTLLQNYFFIELFSPLTCIMIGATIIGCLGRMGKYWLPSFLLSMGIFVYAFADILRFAVDYVFFTDKYGAFISFLYVFPNYFFGLSVAVYFIQKLKGRELYQFLVNTFSLTVIGFVFLRKTLIYLGSFDLISTMDLVKLYLYFSINLFILIMIGHMTVMIAAETGLKGTNTMILGILGYVLMDIPYIYTIALGKKPSNIYTNLIYMLCMILMAHGIVHQVHHHHVFKLKGYNFSDSAVRRTRVIVLLGVVGSILLWILKIVDQSELFYLLMPMLVYWITTTTLQNSALNEQILKQQDILTGLYNRRYSATVMHESVKKAQEMGKKFAVFCVDLNNFKPINDTYGHDMGDRVLKEFGARMLALPSVFTSFRTGGDEFMIIKDSVLGDEDLEKTAMHLQKLFNSPIHIDSYIFSLSGSIGVSVYPDDEKEPELLIRYSDAAMYAVKHSANKDGYKFFDISLVESVEKHKALELKLKNSNPSRDFVLHYQPRIDAGSGKLIGAEVFPRLKDDDSYTAADILPIAEEVGFMARLGNWIIEAALAQEKAWKDNFGKDISMSINLSPLQLLDSEFLNNLKHITTAYGLDPGMIRLDISNDAIMGASITAKETLRALHDYGYKLSLNDFGGYDINLSHILTCGFSAIDISPSLIRRSDTEEDANILIRTIIGLADNLKIDAYAVGIESKEQAEKLKSMGVKSLQGYYFGRPVEAAEFEKTYIK